MARRLFQIARTSSVVTQYRTGAIDLARAIGHPEQFRHPRRREGNRPYLSGLRLNCACVEFVEAPLGDGDTA